SELQTSPAPSGPSRHLGSEITTLRQEILRLQREVSTLQDEKSDLELVLEIHTEHSDSVADELFDEVEKTLRESAKRFRSIVKATPVPIVITRNENREIVYANQLAGPLVGLHPDTVVGRDFLDFYEFSAQAQQIAMILNEQGFVNDYELRLKRVDNTSLLVSLSVQPLTFNNEECSLSVLYDLTELKRAEQERSRLSAIQQELDLAQQIQERLLPPSQPYWQDLDVICYTVPARSVGGDFYTYHPFVTLQPLARRSSQPVEDRRYALAIGDVSGKGMPAALMMAVSFSSLRAIIDRAWSPGQLLAHLDPTLGLYTRTTQQNCALCYAEITVPASSKRSSQIYATLRVANAGCIEPIVKRIDGTVEWIEVTGLPLGAWSEGNQGYIEATVDLQRGDMIILTSDGVVEAMAPTDEMFGFERLEQAVVTGPDRSSEAMLAHLRNEIDKFVGQAEPHDDFTIMVVRVV
ncbi:MAG: SpoIIE family protein phosphatase, partial [Chloroflexota bacterium]